MPRGPSSFDPITGLPWDQVRPATPAGTQAAQLRDPAPITADTPVNPMQREAYDTTGNAYASADEAYGRASKYEDEVTAGTAAETRRELQRARDEISVGMKNERVGAMGRGAGSALFETRAQAAGARGLNELQGRLAGESLRARNDAVNTRIAAAGGKVNAANARTGAANASASETRMLHLGTMAQRLAEQRQLVEQAEAQARMNEMPYQRLASLMATTAQYADAYEPPAGVSHQTGGFGPSISTRRYVGGIGA